jgi:site-specific recombinase XerD
MDFKKTPPICNFSELRQLMFTLMESRNYSENALNTYRKTANILEKYLAEHNTLLYSSEIGNAFLSECKRYRGNYQGKKPGQTDTMRTMVHILNCVMEGVEYGKIPCTPKYVCPDCFLNELNQYLKAQLESGKMEITVSKIRGGCAQFLSNLEKLGVNSLSEITPQRIYASMEDYSSQIVFSMYVPPFLKYLYLQGILGTDYSSLVPPCPTETLVPTVYEKDEIEALLSAIDKTQVKGKRNYAMLLLAARLGLRVSDIVSLTFDNINFDKKIIQFVQKKTGIPLKLPLLGEIEDAINEYTAVRPKHAFQNEIFLSCKAPYFPIITTTIYSFMQKYLRIAKIDIKGKKHGPHSLRSSLASALVSENVPYSVTQKILGHNDSDAIKHYVRLDVEHLRDCALSVPSPSGNFSVSLGMRGVKS